MTSMLRFRDAEEWREWAERRKARWSTRPENSQAAKAPVEMSISTPSAVDNFEFINNQCIDVGGNLRFNPPTAPLKPRPPVALTGPRQFTLTLPYPPSLNHNTQPALGGGRYLTDEHRNFRALVAQIVFAQGVKRLDGKLSVHITVFPPDARKRDLSNLIKPVEDALQRAGAILDDANVDQLSIVRVISEPRAARVIVTVREIA